MQTVLNQPVHIQQMPADEPHIGFGFCLNGQFGPLYDRIKAGDTGCFIVPQHVAINEHLQAGHLLRIYVMLERKLLASFTQGEEDLYFPAFKEIDKNQGKQRQRIRHSITPVMKAVLYQILHCPYSGRAEQFFLESKTMELLSHKLAQIHPSPVLSDSGLKRDDYDRVLYAADILINNLEDPPDVRQLATSVGMSRSKFHRCFRKVYHASPFEYLRNHRLQTAMLLLQSGDINVTEAAFRVGYSNLSYFSKAFKIMFGVAPGELLHNSNRDRL